MTNIITLLFFAFCRLTVPYCSMSLVRILLLYLIKGDLPVHESLCYVNISDLTCANSG